MALLNLGRVIGGSSWFATSSCYSRLQWQSAVRLSLRQSHRPRGRDTAGKATDTALIFVPIDATFAATASISDVTAPIYGATSATSAAIFARDTLPMHRGICGWKLEASCVDSSSAPAGSNWCGLLRCMSLLLA